MSFLFRSLFWLALVVSQIAEREGASLAGLAQPARQELAAGAEQMKERAVEAAVASCRENTASCLALAAQAARLSTPEPASRPGRQSAKDVGQDTLREADRAPAWRLRRPNDGA
jgi:hypothetical protein